MELNLFIKWSSGGDVFCLHLHKNSLLTRSGSNVRNESKSHKRDATTDLNLMGNPRSFTHHNHVSDSIMVEATKAFYYIMEKINFSQWAQIPQITGNQGLVVQWHPPLFLLQHEYKHLLKPYEQDLRRMELRICKISWRISSFSIQTNVCKRITPWQQHIGYIMKMASLSVAQLPGEGGSTLHYNRYMILYTQLQTGYGIII